MVAAASLEKTHETSLVTHLSDLYFALKIWGENNTLLIIHSRASADGSVELYRKDLGSST